MKRRVLALLVIGLSAPATALAAPNGGIELVDRPSGFGPLPFDGISEASAGRHAFSDNGCFLAITSNNDVLSALDDDSGSDVFRVDRCSPGHPATLVSSTPAGAPADGDSFGASISADGTKVAFATTARNLLPPGTTVRAAVVVKDMGSGDVTVASRGEDPAATIAESREGYISGDGGAVVFQGRGAIAASNATGVAGEMDVYVRYLASGDTRMASVTQPPTARGGADGDFDISYDGLEVALTTTAPLDPTDSDDDSAYLARNLLGTVQIDKVSQGQEPRGVAISGDGKQVAFSDNRVWLANCATTCGAPAAIDSSTPPSGNVDIAGLGFPTYAGAPKLVFWTTNRSLVAQDTDTEDDAYVYDLGAASVSRFVPHHAGGVSVGDVDPGDAVAFMSFDPALPGGYGAYPQVYTFDDGGQTIAMSLPDGETRHGETDHTVLDPRHALSTSGRFVVMATDSPALGAVIPVPGRGAHEQVIVRDVLGGATTNVSAGTDGAPADRSAGDPSIDAAGDRVAFWSRAGNLVSSPTPDEQHVYLRDLATGITQRIDRKPDGSAPAGGSYYPAISGDGTKVAFVSESADLPGAPSTDTRAHAYVADVATGSITLVDRTADGTVGDGYVTDVDISADGSRVAFISDAMNLGGFAESQRRVFVKDVASGALTFASAPEGGGTPLLNASAVSLAGDASRVAWAENSADFGYGSDGRPHTFVRDLASQTTTLASVGGPTGPGAMEVLGGLDGNGTHLVFIREFADGGPARVLLRDLTAGTTADLLSAGAISAFDVSLSPDGHCVAFGSNSPGLLPSGSPSPDFDHVYLVGAGADCPPVPPSGNPGGGDTTAPAISHLRMLRKRFAVARKPTAKSARRARRGSAFLFTLSEDARTSIAIARALPGRRAGKRCVKPRRGLKRRCTRYAVVSTLTRTKTRRGPNRVAFSGRIGTRKLRPGRYRATVGAVDAAGNRAKAKRVTFRVVRR